MSKNPPPTVITLTVDTDKLISDPAKKNDYVVFSDNQSDDPGETKGHPETYTSTVMKGLSCTWQGVSLNKRDKVNITDVSKKSEGGGADILEEIALGDPFKDPKVTAKVKNKDIVGPEYYNITFMINGNESLVYTIDPILKMRAKAQ